VFSWFWVVGFILINGRRHDWGQVLINVDIEGLNDDGNAGPNTSPQGTERLIETATMPYHLAGCQSGSIGPQ
jgi:hypothetical protein